MQGVPLQFSSQSDRAEFRQLGEHAGAELYRAHIVHHAFEPHTHEAYGFGAIASGVERFRCGGSDHLAAPGSIVLMNPDALHTGRAETDGGWHYQMIYLEPALLAEISGESGWWFDEAVCHDPQRSQALGRILATLWAGPDSLASDCLLLELASLVQPLASQRPQQLAEGRQRFERVIDYMHSHLAERLQLEELAAIAGLSRFHFLRSFKAQFHVTPQQMLMALRLHRAKQALAAGVRPAQVAVDCGLSDQAHLSRAFSQRYGVSPARYQQQLRA